MCIFQLSESDVENLVLLKRWKPVVEMPEMSAGIRPMLSACNVLLEHLEFFTKFWKLFAK